MPPKKKITRNCREPFQKKQVIKQKSMRGEPETEYGEIKKIASYSLTPTGIELLKSMSRDLGISASEFIERVARKKYQITGIELLEKMEHQS